MAELNEDGLGNLWLRNLDSVSTYIHKGLIPAAKRARNELPTIIRPGGLGDLVILTRACIEVGIDPRAIRWWVETRNAPWADWLSLEHYCYDRFKDFTAAVMGQFASTVTINSEQTYGLSTLFGRRLAVRNGQYWGYSTNRRYDLYTNCLDYSLSTHELEMFKLMLNSAFEISNSKPLDVEQFSPPKDRSLEEPYSIVALAGFQAPEKALSKLEWRQVVEQAEGSGAKILTIGSPQDKKQADEILKNLVPKENNLVGVLSFPQCVQLIRNAERLFSVDSGLVHVADFYNVPTEVIFRTGNPDKWRPLHKSSRVIITNGE